MTGMLIRTFQNRSAAFKRWLGVSLIVFIFYGTTVEAAHRHGRVLPGSGTASLVESEQTNSPVNTRTGCSDCLICQLHQNFTTSLVAFRLADPPNELQLRTCAEIPFDVYSQIAGPTAGRAPPFIS